jgi:flagellar protein FliS
MNTELTYRQTYASGASAIGTMIALFDALVRDLRRAADAVRSNNIEARCREVNHALLVIGHLQNLLDTENGGPSAALLESFYDRLRLRLNEASIQKSAELFETQIELLLQVRTSWQKLAMVPLAVQEPSISKTNEESTPLAAASEECVRLSLSI